VRAYGAGLLSSYGELLHALSKQPAIEYRQTDSKIITSYVSYLSFSFQYVSSYGDPY
jgi:phenylalanine-4-hydroxylase